MIARLLAISNQTLLYYYLLCNLSYLLMLFIAFRTSIAHHRKLQSFRLAWIKEAPLSPPISIIVPAHNEEKSICISVLNLLKLQYPELELIVVNDGSTDATLAALRERFRLRPIRAVYVSQIQSAPVRRIYRSETHPGLMVLDKDSAGSKSDAINAGVNAATCPYICVVDADSVLEDDALLRIMVPVLADPDRVVCVGGIVRVVNGSAIRNGRIERIRLPRKSIEIIQVIEYLRAFLVAREAWASANMLMIVSGAFGVFKTDLVRQLGGYRPHAIGEDFELVVRLHRYLLDKREKYRIAFLPDPVCWTEAPSDLKSLGRQRSRWQKGLLDGLWRHRQMLFRARYGRTGCLALPYLWFFELLAPLIESLGIASIIAAACVGILNRDFFVQFLLFGYAFATAISIGSVLQEELTYRRYNDWRDVARLLLYCFLEHFPYRQIQIYWRLQGMWQYLRGDNTWKTIKRTGLENSHARPSAEGKASAPFIANQ